MSIIENNQDRQDNFAKIKIEDRIYSVQKFHAKKAFSFSRNVLGIIAPTLGEGLEILGGGEVPKGQLKQLCAGIADVLMNEKSDRFINEALAQCFTPENQSLADEGVFNRWFSRYPHDLYELSGKVVWVLIKDFLPKSVLTKAEEIFSGISLELENAS